MYSTKMVFVGASVLMGCWAVIQATPASLRARDAASAQVASLDQDAPQKKLFVTISPEPCRSSAGRTGTCRTQLDCSTRRGTAEGRCAWANIGVCCIDAVTTTTQTCNSRTSSQETTFRNPSYPSRQPTNVGVCTMTVTARSDVCQLRLDLTEFSLAQPNNEGVCATDYLSVTGGSAVPRICGDNDGQHLYVDVTSGSSVNLDIVTGSVNEKWSIKVTQIPCNSPDRAPTGCLQYFTSTSGTITSFNFPSTNTATTRQLADQLYGICIRSQTDYCSVTYTQAPSSSFSVTGDPGAVNPNLPPRSSVGDLCTTDYIIIGGATIVDNTNVDPAGTMTTDRFCGYAFPGATSSISPYKINFVSNGNEALAGDINNQGFRLAYTLNRC